MKKYVIHWKSKVNGRAGKGTKLFDRDAAQQLVNELNREYPQIEHEMVEVRGQTAAEGTSGRSESTPEPMELAATR